MEWLLIVIAIVFALLVLAIIAKGQNAPKWDGPWPFYAKRPLTKPEQVLYHRLIRALPDHIVLCQVQVSRVLGVKRGFKFNQWNNRINRLSYDFVICGKDASVIAVIELDDSTHQKSARQEADKRKDKATNDAEVKMIRWNVKALPDQSAIQAALAPLNLIKKQTINAAVAQESTIRDGGPCPLRGQEISTEEDAWPWEQLEQQLGRYC